MSTAGDLGEDALVARLTKLLTPGPGVLVGPGDDCAVVEDAADGPLTLLKTDCLVEGVHFLPGTDGTQVGWKAVARVVSDFAAMAGEPRFLLVTVALPAQCPASWLELLYRGMDSCAVQCGARIVGGETSSLPDGAPLFISVAASGTAERGRWIGRNGGQPGDLLYVTGRLGGSLAGKHLSFQPRLEEARWLARHAPLHALMDLSDGLAKDLPRLAESSGCGYLLGRDLVPCTAGVTVEQALADGEDYELLFAVAPEAGASLEAQWKERFPELELTRIGELREGEAEEMTGGWEHFR